MLPVSDGFVAHGLAVQTETAQGMGEIEEILRGTCARQKGAR